MAKRRWLSAILALLMVVLFSVPAFANEISDKEKQVEQHEEKKDQLQQEKKSLEEQIEETQAEVKTIEASIAEVNADIKTMTKKINTVQSKIDTATEELEAAIEEYNTHDEAMKQRINALYRITKSGSYLQVLLESKSFSDFITRLDMIQKIMDYDVKMLEKMKAMRDQIEEKKAALEADKAELMALKTNLDSKKAQLLSQKNEQKRLVALLSRNVDKLNEQIRAEEATLKKLEKEIAELMNKEKNYDGTKYAIVHRSDYPSGKQPRITSGFAYRVDPVTGKQGAYHSGIDIGTGGTYVPVYAMSSGKVILAKYYGSYGNCVIIDHGSGLATLYAHNSQLLVKAGDTVSGGQKIAISGSTGRSTGPHIHFGVQKNGTWINPEPYLLIGY